MNKLLQGDCLELMKDIPEGSVDMILCDLPYGVTARNKWDRIIPFESLWGDGSPCMVQTTNLGMTLVPPLASFT